MPYRGDRGIPLTVRQLAGHCVELIDRPGVTLARLDVVIGNEPVPQTGAALCECPIEGRRRDPGRNGCFGPVGDLEQRVELARHYCLPVEMSVVIHRCASGPRPLREA